MPGRPGQDCTVGRLVYDQLLIWCAIKYQCIQDNTWLYPTKNDYTGLYRTLQDYTWLYWTIQTIKGYKEQSWSKVWLSESVSESVSDQPGLRMARASKNKVSPRRYPSKKSKTMVIGLKCSDWIRPKFFGCSLFKKKAQNLCIAA